MMQNDTDTCVAIKWHPTEVIGGREAENLNALTKPQHPNVVRFIDSTNRALLMEHIEGLTLNLHLNRTTMHMLPWEEASLITRGLLLGFGCLHSMKPPLLIADDVSTANVMLRIIPDTDTQQVVIVGFGLSKRTGKAKQTQTVGPIFFGTVPYLAPEVGRVESKDLGARTDVWAAGVMLYEMLTGNDHGWLPRGRTLCSFRRSVKKNMREFQRLKLVLTHFWIERSKKTRSSDSWTP